MRSTCGACSDTQEPIRGFQVAHREDREGRTRITNNHCLAYNCAANVARHETRAIAESLQNHVHDRLERARLEATTACASSRPISSIPNTAQTPGHGPQGGDQLRARRRAEALGRHGHIHPDAKTGAHHHGHLESVIYVVKGRARMRWGDALEFTAEAGPGDFIYVPPYVPHQEINASRDETLECVLVPQRRRGGRGEPRHRAGREARDACAGSTRPIRRLR